MPTARVGLPAEVAPARDTSMTLPAGESSQPSPSKTSPSRPATSSPWNLIVSVMGPAGQGTSGPEGHLEIVPLTISGVASVGGPSAVRNDPPGVTVWVNVVSALAGEAQTARAAITAARWTVGRMGGYSSSLSGLVSSSRVDLTVLVPSTLWEVTVTL